METTFAVENIAQQNLDVSRSLSPRPPVTNYKVSTHYSTASLEHNMRHTMPAVLLDETDAQRTLVPLFLPE
jgi:hypothetical protein